MTRTIGIAKGAPVFISGFNGSRDAWDDMTGHVALVHELDQQITVHWDHPGLAHDPLMRYGAEQFLPTTDRSGVEWLVLLLG